MRKVNFSDSSNWGLGVFRIYVGDGIGIKLLASKILRCCKSESLLRTMCSGFLGNVDNGGEWSTSDYAQQSMMSCLYMLFHCWSALPKWHHSPENGEIRDLVLTVDALLPGLKMSAACVCVSWPWLDHPWHVFEVPHNPLCYVISRFVVHACGPCLPSECFSGIGGTIRYGCKWHNALRRDSNSL